MSDTPTRDWLAEVIRTAARLDSCGSCRSGARTCPRCAAEAVLDACRREELFIMSLEEADAVVEQARRETREALAAELDGWNTRGRVWPATIAQHIREQHEDVD